MVLILIGFLVLGECSAAVALSHHGVAGVDLKKGLIEYWDFDEVTHNRVVGLMERYDGVVFGGAIRVDGRVGFAMRFDGVDDYVEVGQKPLLQTDQLTLALWVLPFDQEIGRYQFHKDIIRSQCFGGGLWGISTSGYFNSDGMLYLQVGWLTGYDTWWFPKGAILAKNRWNHLFSTELKAKPLST